MAPFAQRGQKDDIDVAGELGIPNLFAQLQAVHAGHFPVRDHDLETMLVEHLKRGQPVGGNIHLVALIPQKVAHKM